MHDKRIEPMLQSACVQRDYVNSKERLRDLTPVRRVPCDYLTVALWIICGFLAIWIFIAW